MPSWARKQGSDRAKQLDAGIVWTENVDDVLNSDADVIIETIGGLDPMQQWLERAITGGKHVVTANKQLIAYNGAELTQLARQHGVSLVGISSILACRSDYRCSCWKGLTCL